MSALDGTELGRYLRWLADERGQQFADYQQLWRWSVTDLAGFWSSIWDFCGVRAHTPYEQVLGSREMPGAQWFTGATLNYAEHAVGTPADADQVAIVAYSQTRQHIELTFGQLRDQVARVRYGLRKLGVGRGDRVVAYLPNIPEAVVGYLAAASLGAIWACCAPEFGARSVIDRFAQLEPKVLLAVTGYRYGERYFDRKAEVAEICAGLPTVEHAFIVPYGDADGSWPDILDGPADPGFDPVPFDHPLCVLFSSGTTGKPKAIVHSHGGVLVEHLKNHLLSFDLHPGDRLQWFTTTTWMVWNALVSALLVRASIVLIDGDPQYPDLVHPWRIAEQAGTTMMGASPGFLMACRKAGVHPAKEFDLSRLRQLGAVGSPLHADGFRWVQEELGPDVLLNVGSGGTDVCTGIVQGGPWQPVVTGEISGRCLGVDAKAFDEHGREVVGQLGELVITSPMPSMPVGFWGDTDTSRYRAAYFAEYPGVWRHGDWIRFSDTGSCVVTGRSDATLNRGGVRLGTAEFYAVVEEFDEIADSLIVHLEDTDGGSGELLLFVTIRPGYVLDDALRQRIGKALRSALSPRHGPDTVLAVPSIPRNRTGKKLEVPVKRILQGAVAEDVVSRDVLAEPTSLDAFVSYAKNPR
ncbi:acetoacetate--CoA ligase [Kibdelosporangium aridum]|uniref:acetoacetate--CoA ligase n=1 Tax=Kibdelosporangium aridum TaxID=2030 RepID=UPI0035E4EE0A